MDLFVSANAISQQYKYEEIRQAKTSNILQNPENVDV